MKHRVSLARVNYISRKIEISLAPRGISTCRRGCRVVPVRIDVFEEAPQCREARLVSVPAGMIGEPVRVDVDFVDDVARLAFFGGTPSVQLRPCMVSGRRLADEFPKNVVVVRGQAGHGRRLST